MPLFDNEAATFLNQVYQRADAFLFGRRTYEIFAGYWGVMADPANPIAAALNTRPKYVASTTLTDPQWADTTVLSGDVAAAVGELKAKPAGELQVHGSGALIRWLLDNHLVDEIILLTYPVVIGQGTRLFPDTGPDTALDLVDSRTTPKGLTIQVYRPPAVRNGHARPEGCDVGAALDDRLVPAVWPRPTHVGSEKYLGGFWIIEAPTSTWRSSSPPRGRRPAIGRSRCGRSWASEVIDVRDRDTRNRRSIANRFGRKPEGRETMFGTPLTPDSIKAETAYRLERTKREFRSAQRRQRADRSSQPEPRHARRALRRTAAA